MLAIEAVEVRVGSFHLAADLVIATGARVGMIGPSGAGKSTLLAAIAGFQPLARGRVSWAGQDLAALPPGQRPVTMLFQDGNLFPHLNALQNVALGVNPALRLTKADWARVAASLAEVGLTGLGGRKPAALSGGQQSRVALARALIRARPLLLLDEPFAALGPALTVEMLALVARICTGTGATLLMVSHHPADLMAVTPQTVLVAAGVAHPPQPTAALLANPPADLQVYLGGGAGGKDLRSRISDA